MSTDLTFWQIARIIIIVALFLYVLIQAIRILIENFRYSNG